MNILIVSCEAWRDTNNGGNVLSNIFSVFYDANIAQIYCSGELPQNSVCKKYFQISDSMLLAHKKGCALEEKLYDGSDAIQLEEFEKKIKSSIPMVFREFMLLARELVWTLSDWKTKELHSFIRDFNPDVIFAPCYSYFHVSKLALHVKKIANCPMISYISDDNYSLKQFRFSPSFWINRLITRKWIRRHFAASSLVYTMTDLQKKEYESLLHTRMKVLCKSSTFTNSHKRTNETLKFIYAGGLYLNRWKLLAKLRSVIESINSDKKRAELHIYSNTNLSNKVKSKISDGKNSFLHGAIPYNELQKEYEGSDVAIHVESFDLKNRLITRLSFSTKIIDCMSSGCAILAIGPRTQAGISYLNDNDAAICVDEIDNLHDIVNDLVNNPSLIKKYAENARALGRKNHMKDEIEENLRKDFAAVLKTSAAIE